MRALRIVQAAAVGIAPGGLWPAPAIPRGDLQTTFLFKGFDEVRRLGLLPQTEEEVRSAPHVSHGVPGARPLSRIAGRLADVSGCSCIHQPPLLAVLIRSTALASASFTTHCAPTCTADMTMWRQLTRVYQFTSRNPQTMVLIRHT